MKIAQVRKMIEQAGAKLTYSHLYGKYFAWLDDSGRMVAGKLYSKEELESMGTSCIGANVIAPLFPNDVVDETGARHECIADSGITENARQQAEKPTMYQRIEAQRAATVPALCIDGSDHIGNPCDKCGACLDDDSATVCDDCKPDECEACAYVQGREHADHCPDCAACSGLAES